MFIKMKGGTNVCLIVLGQQVEVLFLGVIVMIDTPHFANKPMSMDAVIHRLSYIVPVYKLNYILFNYALDRGQGKKD